MNVTALDLILRPRAGSRDRTTNLYALHAMTEGDRADAERMRVDATLYAFGESDCATLPLRHRLRAGAGLSPADYSAAFFGGGALRFRSPEWYEVASKL